jgi:sortase (surface protein transpeptidase)
VATQVKKIRLGGASLRSRIRAYEPRPIVYSRIRPSAGAPLLPKPESMPQPKSLPKTPTTQLKHSHKFRSTGSLIDGFVQPKTKPMSLEQCVKAHILIAEMEAKDKIKTILEPTELLTMPLPTMQKNYYLYKLSNGIKLAKNVLGSNLKYVIIAPVILFLVIGSYFGISGFKANQSAETKVKAITSYSSVVTKPTNGADYEETAVTTEMFGKHIVAKDMPRYIRIPSIEIASRIKRVTTGDGNVLKMPKNIHDAGWYYESPKPGELGASLIDGHVFGPTKSGIFYYLFKLSVGETVEIERGDGKVFTYKVVAAELFDAKKVDVTKVLSPYGGKKKGLNLITQAGTFDDLIQDYTQRLVVYTVLQ